MKGIEKIKVKNMKNKKHTRKIKNKISSIKLDLFKNPKNHPMYKDGRTLKKYYCLDCGKKVSYKSKRCQSCNCKNKFKLGILNNKGKNNPNFKDGLYREKARLRNNLSRRIIKALRGKIKKSKSTMQLIGCTIKELKQHLENQFKEGMDWNNYGKWHIDHIIPCARFNLDNEKEQQNCFHYANLQPMWAIDNLRKNDKILAKT